MSVVRPAPGALLSRTRPATFDDDLVATLGSRGFAWVHDGGALVGLGTAVRVAVGPGGDRFTKAASDLEALFSAMVIDDPVRVPGSGPVAVGALPFSDSVAGELIVPKVVLGCTADGRGWVTEIEAEEPVSERRSHASSDGDFGRPSRFTVDGGDGETGWTNAVEQAVAMISTGELSKVVLARQVVVEADRPLSTADVVRTLASTDRSCFVYSAGPLVGASPELLVRRRGDRVVSRPMAGSTRRGATVADDDRLAAHLETSAKELEEHRMVVDAVQEALDGVCEQVVAAAGPEVVRLPTVAHLATTVAGHLRPPAPTALALAGLLHPTPAVAGIPRQAALEAIARLEPFDRGLYAGPVGWVDARGDGDWAVALRCAHVEGNRARLAAGAGIVAGSDPEAEWAETQAKLEPMLRALVRP